MRGLGKALIWFNVIVLFVSVVSIPIGSANPLSSGVAEAAEPTRQEAEDLIRPYRAHLRSLGDYIQGAPIYNQDPNNPTPITIFIPPDFPTSGLDNLEFTLWTRGGVRISALPDNPQTDEEDGYVTNIFYYFSLTKPAKDITLVMDPNGLGALYLGSSPDPSDDSRQFYGNQKDCVKEDPSDPELSVLDLVNCKVATSSSASSATNDAAWKRFAEILIPPDMRTANSCPVTVSAPLAVSGEKEISLFPKAHAVAPIVVAAWALGSAAARWCAVSAAPVIAAAAVRWGGAAITGGVRALKWAGPATLGFFKKHPWVSLAIVGGGLFLGGCGLAALMQSGLDIGAAIAKTIACVFQSFLNGISNFLEEILGPISERSFIRSPPPFSRLVYQETGNLLNNSFFFSGFWIGSAEASLEEELQPNQANSQDRSSILNVWRLSKNLVNFVVVIALLAIAFANILHLNINTYAAKKALPGLVIGVIGANASILIIRFLVDVNQALSQWAVDFACESDRLAFVFLPCNITSLIVVAFPVALGRNAFEAILIALVTLAPLFLIVATVLIICYLLLILVFAWTLFKRLVILYILIMISPLAFVAYGIPGLQSYFGKWWDAFLRYLFMFAVILFGMAMVVRLSDTFTNSGDGFQHIIDGDRFSLPGLINVLIVLAAGFAVLKIPGLVTKGTLAIDNAAKKAFGMARETPVRVAAAGGMIQKKLNAKKMSQLDSQYQTAMIAGNRGQAAGIDLQRMRLKQSGKTWSGRWDTTRGWVNIASRPEETAKKWWEERQDEAKTKDMIESSKLGVGRYNVQDTITGPERAFKNQTKRIREEVGPLRTQAQLRQYLKNAPTGTEDLYNRVTGYANTLNDQDWVDYTARIGGARNNEDLLKALNEAGITGTDLQQVVQRVGVKEVINKALAESTRRQPGNAANRRTNAAAVLPFGGSPSSPPSPPTPPPYSGPGSPAIITTPAGTWGSVPGGGRLFTPAGGGGPSPHGTSAGSATGSAPPPPSTPTATTSPPPPAAPPETPPSPPEPPEIPTIKLDEETIQKLAEKITGSDAELTGYLADRFGEEIDKVGALHGRVVDPREKYIIADLFGQQLRREINGPKGLRGALESFNSKIARIMGSRISTPTPNLPTSAVPSASQPPSPSIETGSFNPPPETRPAPSANLPPSENGPEIKPPE